MVAWELRRALDEARQLNESFLLEYRRKPETSPTIRTTWTMRFFVHSFGFLVFSCVSSFFPSFTKKKTRVCNDFDPKIVKIGAILAIFRPIQDFRFFLIFCRWCPGGGVSGSGESIIQTESQGRK